jgi:cephalosporin-C deacetylase-like acetyl esterase
MKRIPVKVFWGRELPAGYIVLLAMGLGCLPVPAEAQEPRLALAAEWKFKKGDDSRWSSRTLDDQDWNTMRVGKAWDRTYDGYGWYRLKVKIPGHWQQDPVLSKYQHLSLQIGLIDDADQAWFNGKLVGQTGFPLGAEITRQKRNRIYQVPGKLVRWGEENVIAVRVHDAGARGGLYRGPYRIGISNWKDLVELQLGRGRGDGIFPAGKPMEFTATLENRSSRVISGHLKWNIQTDEKTDVHHESRPLTLAPGKRQDVRSSFLPSRPGFFFAQCSFVREDGEVSRRMQLGYAPEKIFSASTREADFEEFWNQARQELEQVDPQFEVIPQPSANDARVDLYEVRMRSLGNVRVAGWYEVPRKPGRYPAILRVPGYGQNMRPIDRFEDMVVFSFNVRGHGNSQQDVKGRPQDYWIRGLDDKQDYYYRGAYLDCLRAVDFLVSRPEVDAKRIAIMGGSQGGGFSFATAALDPRIAASAPDIPFMADFVRYFQTSNWPEMDQWIAAKEKRTWPRTLRTLSYFDTMNLAPWIRCPVFMGVGLQDPICPPSTNFTLYNRVPGKKQYRVYPFSGHGVGAGHRELVFRWLREQLGLK